MSPPAARSVDPEADAVIIGGGVVGMALAYGLTDAGLSVLVLDEGDVAHRASRANFALVWVQGKGMTMPDYARWTLRSADLWPAFAADIEREAGLSLAYERRGGVMACLTGEELDARAAALGRLHNAVPGAASVERLDHAGLKALMPEIGPDVAGGTYCPADGHLNSLRLFHGLHAIAGHRGVHYRPNAAVETIEPISGGFRIVTAAGEVQAPRVVLAAGLGNARLAPMVGLHAPVRPQRGEVMVTEKLAPFLTHPVTFLRQTDEGGVMIGDSQEETGFDTATDSQVLAAIAARAMRVFPVLAGARVVRTWSGLRVMSPDGYPVYDTSARCPGASLVTCHSGITLAAVHARVIARAIAGDWPADLAPFSARRFADVPAT